MGAATGMHTERKQGGREYKISFCNANFDCCAVPLPAFPLRWRGDVLVLLVNYTANKHCLICSDI